MAGDCLAAVPEPPEGQELHDLLQHWPPPSRAPNATPGAASVSSSAVGVRTVVHAGNGDEVAGVGEAVQDPVGAAAGTPLTREVIAQWFADPDTQGDRGHDRHRPRRAGQSDVLAARVAVRSRPGVAHGRHLRAVRDNAPRTPRLRQRHRAPPGTDHRHPRLRLGTHRACAGLSAVHQPDPPHAARGARSSIGEHVDDTQ